MEDNAGTSQGDPPESSDAPKKLDIATLPDFMKESYKTLMEAIRCSNLLPSDGDYSYYNTLDSFKNAMKNDSDWILGLMNGILRTQVSNKNIRNRRLEDQTELLIEANDTILERVANNIDEMNGIKKTPVEGVVMQAVSAELPINGSWNRVNRAKFSVNSSINQTKGLEARKSISLLTGKNILRPQKFFKDKINNSNSYPWEPRIKEKPNSLKPLALFLEDTEFGPSFTHPYDFELENFEPKEDQLTPVEPLIPKPVEETPLIDVATPEALDALVEELRGYKEIAIDLEHHSYRSFMGITCLMQISTKDKDYIVDTLALRDKLHVLNEIFTKQTIVKIFHGADSDIQWLQRDLSLYVVNMFDTHQAAKQLGYSGLSLAYLLNRFCQFMPNKRFQLADWRIRPLPEELKLYAREDTHYLIYIYHLLRNELLKKANGKDNILKAVIAASTEICHKRYMKPLLTETSHLDFYRKCKRMFDNRQMFALKELYAWRDSIAREEDESTGYVLPNHMLLQIAEALPREVQGILACCNPIPPLVRANLVELHEIILRARDQSLQKPIMKEDNRSRGSTQQISKINIDSPLHCPHDLTKLQEFRDDLPTLLGGSTRIEDVLMEDASRLEKTKPSISVFDSPGQSEDEDTAVVMKLKKLKFLGPYERYKLVKPFLQAEEARIAAERKENPEGRKDDASVEDRIASLHEHFKKTVANTVSEDSPESAKPSEERETLQNRVTLQNRETPQAQDENVERVRSLVEMGGRKRKKDWKNCESAMPNPEMEDHGQCLLESAPAKRKRDWVQHDDRSAKKEKKSFYDDVHQSRDRARDEIGTPRSSQNKKFRSSTHNADVQSTTQADSRKDQGMTPGEKPPRKRRYRNRALKRKWAEEANNSNVSEAQDESSAKKNDSELAAAYANPEIMAVATKIAQDMLLKQGLIVNPTLLSTSTPQNQMNLIAQPNLIPSPLAKGKRGKQAGGANVNVVNLGNLLHKSQTVGQPKKNQNTHKANNNPPQKKGNLPQSKPPANGNQNKGKKFQPFDYGSVDFNQFQGGAEVKKKQTRRSLRKGQRKNKFKGESKSMTFGKEG